jgi:HPt (histidine-containing phosphotransfer) domain-containing protein
MAARVEADVNVLVARARQLEQAGRLDEGRRSLNAAYEMAKGTIEELRGGDTLVRALEFASKEEEYRYELDRNDTHQMLITVLVEEKRSSRGVDQMVTKYVQRAQTLRGEAERQAGAGDFAKAVATLEQSTKELVRAIRSAGVYIPG